MEKQSSIVTHQTVRESWTVFYNSGIIFLEVAYTQPKTLGEVMYMDKEEKNMDATAERLVTINKKIDSKIDDIWAKAETNLKKLEQEFLRNKEGRRKE